MSEALAETLRLDEYLPYRLSVASEQVSRLIARAYAERFSLRISEWRVIANLSEGGGLTPQELAARTCMDKVTVSRAAQVLLRRQLIERAPHAADRRSHVLTLTAHGRRLFEEVAPVARRYEQALLAAFTSDEADQIKSLLIRIERRAGELSRS